MKIAPESFEDAKERPKNNMEKEGNNVSVGDIWREFREGSSLHGVKYITTQKSYFHGVFWTVWTLTMLGFLVWMVVTLYQTYFSYPKMTSIVMKDVKEITFPSVTMCNISPYNSSNVDINSPELHIYLRTISLSLSMVMSMPTVDLNQYPELQSPRSSEWLSTVTFHPLDMMQSCTFEKNVNYQCVDLLETRVTDSGVCLTFNGYKVNQSLSTKFVGNALGLVVMLFVDKDNYVLSDSMGTGLKVVVHDPGVEPNVKDQNFLVRPGTVTYASLSMTKYTYLPPPFKAFDDAICLDTESPAFINPLKFYSPYSHYACIRECRTRYIHENCLCRLPTDKGDTEICTILQEFSCASPYGVTFDTTLELQSKCNCPRPCSDTRYEVAISQSGYPASVYEPFFNAAPEYQFSYETFTKNFLELRVFFNSLSYKSVEQVPKMGTEDVLGMLGGYFGICLGASVITLSEIVETFLFTIYVLIKAMIVRSGFQPK